MSPAFAAPAADADEVMREACRATIAWLEGAGSPPAAPAPAFVPPARPPLGAPPKAVRPVPGHRTQRLARSIRVGAGVLRVAPDEGIDAWVELQERGSKARVAVIVWKNQEGVNPESLRRSPEINEGWRIELRAYDWTDGAWRFEATAPEPLVRLDEGSWNVFTRFRLSQVGDMLLVVHAARYCQSQSDPCEPLDEAVIRTIHPPFVRLGMVALQAYYGFAQAGNKSFDRNLFQNELAFSDLDGDRALDVTVRSLGAQSIGHSDVLGALGEAAHSRGRLAAHLLRKGDALVRVETALEDWLFPNWAAAHVAHASADRNAALRFLSALADDLASVTGASLDCFDFLFENEEGVALSAQQRRSSWCRGYHHGSHYLAAVQIVGKRYPDDAIRLDKGWNAKIVHIGALASAVEAGGPPAEFAEVRSKLAAVAHCVR